MKRVKQFSIWIIALLAMTVTNYAWADDTQYPKPGKLTVGTVTANSIALSWTRGSDNITPQSKLKYRVLWKKKSDNDWQVSHYNYQVNMTSYTITGLEANTEYIVDVAVRDEADNGVFYGEKNVKTDKDTKRPTPGGYLGFPMAISSTEIVVKWHDATDDVTPHNKLMYKVAWKKKSDSDWQYSSYTVDINSYTITGLQPNTYYDINVQVVDQSGNGIWYGLRRGRTEAAPDTQNPTPGGYETGYPKATGPTTIEVKWTRGSDNVTAQNKLRYYVLWRKESDNSGSWSFSHTSNLPVDITSYTITGLQPDTEYRVDVSVRDEANNGVFYGEKIVTTKQATTPAVPVTDVTLNRNTFTVNGDYEEVQLTATVAPSNATDKSLTWSSDNPQVASVDGNGLVTIHKKGKARVTARANDGSGRYDACDFNVIMTVGNETVDGLRVYAAGSALYLTLPQAQTVHIYNVDGAMVKTLTLSAGDHVQPLPSGVYLVRVGESVTKILVK